MAPPPGVLHSRLHERYTNQETGGANALQLEGELTASFNQIVTTLACDQAHDRIVEDGELWGAWPIRRCE